MNLAPLAAIGRFAPWAESVADDPSAILAVHCGNGFDGGLREFIVGLASTIAPCAARAQQAGKLPTVGFLGTDASLFSLWTTAFVERLGQLVWIDGRTVAIEYRWAQGRHERETVIAAEFVRLKIDVIVKNGDAVPIVKQATAVIPVIFAMAQDPIGAGIVASLARPGGNVTGLSIQQPILPASGSNSCARLPPGSAAWRSWPMLAIPSYARDG